MDKTKRQSLLAYVNTLDDNERNKLHKKANELRKRHMALSERPREHTRVRARDVDEDDEPRVTVRRTPPLEEFILRLLEQEQTADVVETGASLKGVVIALAKGRARVVPVCPEDRAAESEIECLLAPDLARRQQSEVAVGDEVLVHQTSDGRVIRQVMPRRTMLSRPDPDTGLDRVIFANVDVVVVVVSVGNPPLHPRIVDRFLIAIARGGARPILAVNKLDLLTPEQQVEELQKVEPYRQAGVPIVCCSAHSGSGIDELRALMRGLTGVFAGHSGVGKSSLLNAIKPELDLKTGGVSEVYGRGRHTTTSSTLLDLGDGTRLIDTPGIRSFGLSKIRREELPWYFPEFDEHACRFRDCRHVREPGCAVLVAIENGLISQARYEAYLRILETIA